MSKEKRRLILIALFAMISIMVVVLGAYYFFSKLEKKLIDEKKQLCLSYAGTIAGEIDRDSTVHRYIQLAIPGTLSRDSSKMIDSYFTALLNQHLVDVGGLEGGIYIAGLNDFMGYAFPTSPPPVPVYGPPPRSHEIIRGQAELAVNESREIVNVHAFDPAVFPLATVPFSYAGEPAGAIWIRVHIERELPVARLRRIINFATILFLFGFVVMALISLFLRSGIKNIRKELISTYNNPGYRLKNRGGWFGFIPASINEMLATLEKENKDRVELEKRLQQKEKMASLGKMIAGVAHEVKTPLSVVKTRVQMWEKMILESAEMQEKISPDSLKFVLDEINRISLLVKRLVVFSRPIHQNMKPTDIRQLMEEVVGLIDLGGSKKEIYFSPESCNKVPLIEADGNTIRQVLINVINNAVDSIEDEGKVSLSCCYDAEKRMVVMEIMDTGPGIPDEIMEQIFEPFFTSKETGTGLGLTISHEIVSAHNGLISFRNMEGGGLNCSITLPEQQLKTEHGK